MLQNFLIYYDVKTAVADQMLLNIPVWVIAPTCSAEGRILATGFEIQ